MPTALNEYETVLAIDPGNFDTAWVVLQGDGHIKAFGKDRNEQFVKELQAWTSPDTMRERVSHVACEMICSYGMAVGASVFETCLFIGEIRRLSEIEDPVVLVGRQEVKLSICKSPRANDSNIRQALIDQFGRQGTKRDMGPTYGMAGDVWAALALAETFRRGEFRPYVFSNDRIKK